MHGHTTSSLLLARLAQADDQLAWHEFYARYGELIRQYAGRWGLQSSDRDDVVQDVLTELAKTMPQFEYDRERGRFRGFLKTVTTRVIIRRVRRRGTAEVLMDEAALNEAAAEEKIESQWDEEWRRHHVRQAMRVIDTEFNEATRLAFQQYAIEGMNVQNTAEQLGLSIDQVYQAKSRVLRRLGELVQEQVNDEG